MPLRVGSSRTAFTFSLLGIPLTISVQVLPESRGVDGGIGRRRVKMAGFDDRNLLKRRHVGRRDLGPMGSAIGGEMNAPVVGPGPEAPDLDRRGPYRVNYAALGRLRGGLAAELADSRRNFKSLARQIGTDLLPALPAVRGLPKSVAGEIKNVRIDRRKNDRLGAQHAEIRRAKRFRHDVLRLSGTAVVARQLAPEHNVGIQRIRHHIAVLFGSHGVPLAKGDLPVVATAGDARRTALLLAAAQPVG